MSDDPIVKALNSVFRSTKNFDHEPAGSANMVDGLFAIARSIDGLAYQIKNLGTADAATPMGAIEILAKEVGRVAESLSSIESAINVGASEIAGAMEEK